jgi:hypothetical protein
MGGVHDELNAVEWFMLNFFRELFELLVSIIVIEITVENFKVF